MNILQELDRVRLKQAVTVNDTVVDAGTEGTIVHEYSSPHRDVVEVEFTDLQLETAVRRDNLERIV
jgi:hypothetical protein